MSNRKGYIISDQYATYYLTFTIVGWVDLFTRKELKDIFIASLKFCQSKKGLNLNAYVIMSSHIHLVASADKDSAGLSSIVRDLKRHTAKEIINFTTDHKKIESRHDWLDLVFKYHAKFNKNNKTYKVWQDSNHPKLMLHPRFIMQKIDYIHNNPVTAGIVKKAEDYIYSSAGIYSGIQDDMLNISVVDFGVQEGYVFN